MGTGVSDALEMFVKAGAVLVIQDEAVRKVLRLQELAVEGMGELTFNEVSNLLSWLVNVSMVRRPLCGKESRSWVGLNALLIEHIFDVYVVVVSGCAVEWLATVMVEAAVFGSVCDPCRRAGTKGEVGRRRGDRVATCDAIDWKTENKEARDRTKQIKTKCRFSCGVLAAALV